jgi:hypothetical protein
MHPTSIKKLALCLLVSIASAFFTSACSQLRQEKPEVAGNKTSVHKAANTELPDSAGEALDSLSRLGKAEDSLYETAFGVYDKNSASLTADTYMVIANDYGTVRIYDSLLVNDLKKALDDENNVYHNGAACEFENRVRIITDGKTVREFRITQDSCNTALVGSEKFIVLPGDVISRLEKHMKNNNNTLKVIKKRQADEQKNSETKPKNYRPISDIISKATTVEGITIKGTYIIDPMHNTEERVIVNIEDEATVQEIFNYMKKLKFTELSNDEESSWETVRGVRSDNLKYIRVYFKAKDPNYSVCIIDFSGSVSNERMFMSYIRNARGGGKIGGVYNSEGTELFKYLEERFFKDQELLP